MLLLYGGVIEMYYYLFGWVEGKWVGVFDFFNIGLIFRINEGCFCVGGVDVYLKFFFFICKNKFIIIIWFFLVK